MFRSRRSRDHSSIRFLPSNRRPSLSVSSGSMATFGTKCLRPPPSMTCVSRGPLLTRLYFFLASINRYIDVVVQWVDRKICTPQWTASFEFYSTHFLTVISRCEKTVNLGYSKFESHASCFIRKINVSPYIQASLIDNKNRVFIWNSERLVNDRRKPHYLKSPLLR